ncbi:tyrosine-type recombinase/integrase [Mycobacterium avium]|uniref:tyrosine-type recombinase/integrase n=1 Tax=Mycobacterium avium TaxID=1764 RepID=UPI0026658D14|nr:site-specific integrase [Mycobacterium avium]MDO2354676.1 tyrosine-type recombinase/integrase [Mycobacterium avium subsp. hominissuis]
MAGKKGHRGWGWLRQSGRGRVKRWHASYLHEGVRHNAPHTYAARADAEGWLASERRLIELDAWTPPAQRKAEKQAAGLTLADYTPTWIAQRTVAGQPLKPRTKSHYTKLFEEHIKPTQLGKIPMRNITADAVRAWHATTLIDKPTYRSHAYQLLHAVLATAVSDGHLQANPAVIRGAGSAATKKESVILDVDEVGQLSDAIDEKFKALILISAWCGLRWGEVTALERRDISADHTVITVRRGVVHRDGKCLTDTTKTKKARAVAVPPHIQPALKHHLATYVDKETDALLFAADRSCHLTDKTFRRYYQKALTNIGRDGKNKPRPSIHDMRHFAGTQAARVGNLVETMGRLGHTTIKASLIYQGIVSGRDAEIAAALSALAAPDANDKD